MGLDFSVDFEIYKKLADNDSQEKATPVYTMEVAYWRKAYGIARRFMQEAHNSSYLLSEDWDFCCNCSCEILNNLIIILLDNLYYDDSELWTDSIFGAVDTKRYSIYNLAKLMALKDWLSYRDEDIDSFRLAKYDNDFGPGISDELYADILANPNKYEFRISIINSY